MLLLECPWNISRIVRKLTRRINAELDAGHLLCPKRKSGNPWGLPSLEPRSARHRLHNAPTHLLPSFYVNSNLIARHGRRVSSLIKFLWDILIMFKFQWDFSIVIAFTDSSSRSPRKDVYNCIYRLLDITGAYILCAITAVLGEAYTSLVRAVYPRALYWGVPGRSQRRGMQNASVARDSSWSAPSSHEERGSQNGFQSKRQWSVNLCTQTSWLEAEEQSSRQLKSVQMQVAPRLTHGDTYQHVTAKGRKRRARSCHCIYVSQDDDTPATAGNDSSLLSKVPDSVTTVMRLTLIFIHVHDLVSHMQ